MGCVVFCDEGVLGVGNVTCDGAEAWKLCYSRSGKE